MSAFVIWEQIISQYLGCYLNRKQTNLHWRLESSFSVVMVGSRDSNIVASFYFLYKVKHILSMSWLQKIDMKVWSQFWTNTHWRSCLMLMRQDFFFNLQSGKMLTLKREMWGRKATRSSPFYSASMLMIVRNYSH